ASILLRVAIAMALGAVIGFEREAKEKPAGVRTHMLVAGASALLLLISQKVVEQYIAASPDPTISADPIRVIQAIVVGVSFIGAGTIFKGEGDQHILYLTTAASILFTA